MVLTASALMTSRNRLNVPTMRVEKASQCTYGFWQLTESNLGPTWTAQPSSSARKIDRSLIRSSSRSPSGPRTMTTSRT